MKVKSTEAEFDDLSKVADKCIQDTTDGGRIWLGVVRRLEMTFGSAVTYHDDALAT